MVEQDRKKLIAESEEEAIRQLEEELRKEIKKYRKRFLQERVSEEQSFYDWIRTRYNIGFEELAEKAFKLYLFKISHYGRIVE